MTLRTALWRTAGGLLLLSSLYAFQRPFRLYPSLEPYDNVEMPPDASEKTEWVFARLMYPQHPNSLFGRYSWRSGAVLDWREGGTSWTQDYPRADRHFAQALRRLTRVHVRSVEQPVNLDDDNDVFNWPWMCAGEMGDWKLTAPQAKKLREYLLRGGFLMLDDFWGREEWDRFEESMKVVFPDRSIVDIDNADSIFHTVYDVNDRIQIPGQWALRGGMLYRIQGTVPHWMGIYDDSGRVMVAISFNNDVGDSWEWADDPGFPEKYSALGFRLGVNYVVYSLTTEGDPLTGARGREYNVDGKMSKVYVSLNAARLLLAPLVLVPLALVAAESVAPSERYSPAERRHWAFQPRKNPAVPAFPGNAWVQSPIDAFVFAGLQKLQLAPAPAADRRTLIRRVTYDLTGLPPAPEEIEAFVKDKDPKAYEKLIDRLLASPRYGEKWGQHWLDVVRFAETDGFEYDTHRPDAWRYRDYVIRSFNRDKPYDQFVREQLAGDELSMIDEEMRIAAGFNRLGPLRKNAGNQEVASSRTEVLTEMTNIVGSAFLGVTLGCARCHDHKFDPIRHSDYYRIQAYFAATQPDDLQLSSAEEQAAYKTKADAIDKQMKDLRKTMAAAGAPSAEIDRKVNELEDQKPNPPPALYSVKEDLANVTPVHVLTRGDYRNKGPQVHPRPLGVLLADGTPELPEAAGNPRTKLAEWVVSPQNPLTARVIANRVWLYHFGRGIVPTPNDFGRMGTRPSNPDLLDYLANRFVDSGWKFKTLHREILLSNAYRQSSHSPLEKLAQSKDPNNDSLWHFERRRLEAEEIRDASLAVAGKLNLKTGGPSIITPVDPDLPQMLYKPSQWKVNPDENEHYRRSVYLIAKRNLRLPMMEVFDAPDFQISCPRRDATTHPPQALELLNGMFANKMAGFLAARLKSEAGANPAKQVDLAYRLAAGRAPTPKERAIGERFLKTGPLQEFALAILNLNAFLYVE